MTKDEQRERVEQLVLNVIGLHRRLTAGKLADQILALLEPDTKLRVVTTTTYVNNKPVDQTSRRPTVEEIIELSERLVMLLTHPGIKPPEALRLKSGGKVGIEGG